MVEPVQQGTIMSEVYCGTLKETVYSQSGQKAWIADIQCSTSP
jgi:hypothetical protein